MEHSHEQQASCGMLLRQSKRLFEAFDVKVCSNFRILLFF